MSGSSIDNLILWIKEDNDYVNFRNSSTAHFPLSKDFFESKTEKKDETLKKKRRVRNEIFDVNK